MTPPPTRAVRRVPLLQTPTDTVEGAMASIDAGAAAYQCSPLDIDNVRVYADLLARLHIHESREASLLKSRKD